MSARTEAPGEAGVRVSYDARLVGLPGIGRFITGLWAGLRAIGVDVVALWPHRPPRDWLGEHHFGPAGPHVRLRTRPFLPGEQIELPITLYRARASVHHAPHLNVPYATRLPIVLTVHDLIAYHDPGKARSRTAGAYYRNAFPLAIRRARMVVAVSPFTARQVMEAFRVPAARVRVIEGGIDHDRWRPQSTAATAAVRERFGLPSAYLLYVGTAKPHKNLATLIAAHTSAHPPLVLAGPTLPEVAALGIELPCDGRVRVLGRVPDAALPGLYSGARALVLPSLNEGCGLTPLEAMACGTPAVVSNAAALPDTVGDAGLLVPPLDRGAWREALTTITDDDALHDRLVLAGRAWAARRDWCTAARRYVEVYEEACS